MKMFQVLMVAALLWGATEARAKDLYHNNPSMKEISLFLKLSPRQEDAFFKVVFANHHSLPKGECHARGHNHNEALRRILSAAQYQKWVMMQQRAHRPHQGCGVGHHPHKNHPSHTPPHYMGQHSNHRHPGGHHSNDGYRGGGKDFRDHNPKAEFRPNNGNSFRGSPRG